MFYLHEPYFQDEAEFSSRCKDIYYPLLRLIKSKAEVKVSIIVSVSFIENMVRTDHVDWLTDLKELVDREKVELVNTSAYNTIHIDSKLFEEDVVLNEYVLSCFFGQKQVYEGEDALVIKDLNGIYVPYISSEAQIRVIDSLSYNWVLINDMSMFSKSFTDESNIKKINNINIVNPQIIKTYNAILNTEQDEENTQYDANAGVLFYIIAENNKYIDYVLIEDHIMQDISKNNILRLMSDFMSVEKRNKLTINDVIENWYKYNVMHTSVDVNDVSINLINDKAEIINNIISEYRNSNIIDINNLVNSVNVFHDIKDIIKLFKEHNTTSNRNKDMGIQIAKLKVLSYDNISYVANNVINRDNIQLQNHKRNIETNTNNLNLILEDTNTPKLTTLLNYFK